MCILPRNCQGVGSNATQTPSKPFHFRPQLFGLALMLLLAGSVRSFADVNSWTKPASGSWEEPQWSLGVLPGPGQSVAINNPGWKAVQISWITSGNYPQTLNVRDLTISSPVDSFNTLLLNYAGFDVPLTVNYSLTVGNNSALTMYASALNIATPTGVGLSIGGEVNQNESSQVWGTQLDVGWIGPGVYNLNSGTLNVGHVWVGGPYAGVFNQNGGNNQTPIVHLESGAVYNMRGGDLTGEIYFNPNTVFQQDGGQLHFKVSIFGGKYILNDGMNYGGVTVPVYANYQRGDGSVTQNGGTNLGPIMVGGQGDFFGNGSYTISNGVVSSPSIYVGLAGGFRLVNGTVTTPSVINVRGGSFNRGDTGYASFSLDSGFLSSGGININLGSLGQTGGTNQVGGDLILQIPGWYGSEGYALSGGLLTDNNTSIESAERSGFLQTGGTHRIANQLTISGEASPYFADHSQGYVLSGGELNVSDIIVNARSRFERTGGVITQSGILSLIASHLYTGPGTQQFGRLAVGSYVPGYGSTETNSTLHMPSNSCTVLFRDSRTVPWSPDATLTIANWNGSLSGGGAQRVAFGNSASAITAQQLKQIYFQNPGGGLSPGVYSTKILSTGEIVPDGAPPVGRISPRMTVRKQAGGFAITVAGEAGYTYGVLRCFDLKDWALWTSGTANSNGTLTVTDTEMWPSARYYKGVLMH